MAKERTTYLKIADVSHTFVFNKAEIDWTEERALKAQKIMDIYHRHEGEPTKRLTFGWNSHLRDWFKT